MGPRDIHKVVLGHPLTRFKPKAAKHVSKAELAKQVAEKISQRSDLFDNASDGPDALGRARANFKTTFQDEFEEIDKLITEVCIRHSNNQLERFEKRRQKRAEKTSN